jgi:putative tricarboxylic transport membrane protein
MKVADLIGGTVGASLGLFALWTAWHMPADVVMKIGPGFFPGILSGLLVLFSCVLLVRTLRGPEQPASEAPATTGEGQVRGLLTLVATVAFVAVLEPLGFIPSAIVFLTLMMLVMGQRKPLPVLLAPTLVTVGVWLVFEKLLHLSMPPGILEGLLSQG